MWDPSVYKICAYGDTPAWLLIEKLYFFQRPETLVRKILFLSKNIFSLKFQTKIGVIMQKIIIAAVNRGW